ncbi:erythroblast NAD(P)(+)--arginine ADP-ribosyltransferase [Chelmon rostratus]|uniref:erythroblast NAD(P)(+)--arginine ADP-ribosyltransferase n=1 Tax=Chelmon rostratus TaxID=109905 RepID=UPI001BE6F60E|nr:erythroblast NAD(P)(+)--arginine ADP-ribosyltransferase [Chelmon rostratus]
MWDKRKLLLAAIVFIALYHKVTAERAKLLDMAPDAVDDIYKGCRKQALERFIHSGLLRQELNHSEGFQRAWSGNPQCSRLIPGGIKEHTAALLAYDNGDEHFIQSFNDAVETLGVNVSTYENLFDFKSLHFLLMDSMSLHPKKCQTVFALQEKYKATQGSKVRFGRFITAHSSYARLRKLEDWDGAVIFNITSCFFVNLGDNICSNRDIVLLSPAEAFTVEEVKKVADSDDTEYTAIVMKHSQLDSMHNCYIFSRSPADVSSQWIVWPFAVLSLFLFNNK